MRRAVFAIAFVLAVSFSAPAQTADEILNKYFQKIGGIDRLKALQTMRITSKFVGGGGFEAVIVGESKRPNMVRQDFFLQGFAAVSAYDGKSGWKINPFQGKKDAEALSEEELKSMVDESDFDGPLIDYAKKGTKVEFVGKEEFEGDDVYKLKVTLPSGTVKHYYMDTEYYVPLKVETRQTVRGTEIESETIFGDYKEVGGIYYAFSMESGPKGSSNKSTVTVQKIEVNVPIDDQRFAMPKN